MGREEDAKSQRGVQILGETELREVSKVEDAAGCGDRYEHYV